MYFLKSSHRLCLSGEVLALHRVMFLCVVLFAPHFLPPRAPLLACVLARLRVVQAGSLLIRLFLSGWGWGGGEQTPAFLRSHLVLRRVSFRPLSKCLLSAQPSFQAELSRSSDAGFLSAQRTAGCLERVVISV